MHRIRLLSVLALVLALAVPAFAQIEQGTFELNFMAALSRNTVEDADEDLDIGNVAVRGGFFLTPMLQVGGTISLIAVTVDDVDASVAALGGFAALHIPLQIDTLVPYVGAGAGMGRASVDAGGGMDDDIDMFYWRVFGGVKIIIKDGVALVLEPSYMQQTLSNGDDVDVTRLGIDAGFSILL